MVYTPYQMDGCSLATLPAGTIDGVVFPTADVKCMCGDTMSDVIVQRRGDYAYVQCVTGVETLLMAPGPTPPPGTQLVNHAVASMTISISTTATQSITCGNTTTLAPATTTRYTTDNCSLTTVPAGTIDGIVFPTADVKCACGGNGTVMASVKTWNAGGSAYTACATGPPTTTLPPIAVTAPTATTYAIANGSSSVAAGAEKTGGASPFDDQTGGAKDKMDLGAMLVAVLALGAALALGLSCLLGYSWANSRTANHERRPGQATNT